MFYAVMNDFMDGRVDTIQTMETVSKLFAGDGPLLNGFNQFLPVGYRIHPVHSRHTPYLYCDSENTAKELAHSFMARVTAELRAEPAALVDLMRAINKVPSDLPKVDSVDKLLGLYAEGYDVPVAGLTIAQAEQIREAAAEVEDILQRFSPSDDESLLHEFMNYLPLGLQHGLSDCTRGYTHFVCRGR